MLHFIWNITGHVIAFVRPWMPSNIILEALGARSGVSWSLLTLLLAAPYFALTYWCSTLIDAGYSKALYLVMLVCICSAFKFLTAGIVSFVRLAYRSVRESRSEQRRDRDSACATCQGSSSEN